MNKTSPIATFVLAAALVVCSCLAGPASAADPLSEQKAKVAQSSRRVEAVSARLNELLAQIAAVTEATSSASGKLGVAHLQLDRAHLRAADAKWVLDARARAAYMRGPWGLTQMLFGSKDLRDLGTYWKVLAGEMKQDLESIQRYSLAAESITKQEQSIDNEKQHLLASSAKLTELRRQVQQVMAGAQQTLGIQQAELDKLKQQRQRQLEAERASKGHVSPAVEAIRSARQRTLDARLAALLAWYAPGTGDANYLPAGMRSSGIVTTGLASWYGPGFDGQRSSSGATYHQDQLTAASLVLPFGTLLKVTFRSRSVVVVITDRGPYVAGRALDLSAGASRALGHSGVQQVQMEILIPAPGAPAFP